MKDVAGNPVVAAYLEKREALVRHFTLRMGSQAAAEDLVQDMYLRIASAETEAVEKPVPFLYRLGANLMLDRIKQAKRAAARDGAWRSSRGLSPDAEDVDPEPPAEDRIADRQRLTRLLDAVRSLPAQRGRAFRLHKIDGLSHAATAETMGISRSAVEKHIILALRQLVAALRE